MWPIRTTSEFDEWFADLDDDGRVEAIAKIELLKLLGPALKRPHADTLKGSRHANMKELRADTADCGSRSRSILTGSAYSWSPATSPV